MGIIVLVVSDDYVNDKGRRTQLFLCMELGRCASETEFPTNR